MAKNNEPPKESWDQKFKAVEEALESFNIDALMPKSSLPQQGKALFQTIAQKLGLIKKILEEKNIAAINQEASKEKEQQAARKQHLSKIQNKLDSVRKAIEKWDKSKKKREAKEMEEAEKEATDTLSDAKENLEAKEAQEAEKLVVSLLESIEVLQRNLDQEDFPSMDQIIEENKLTTGNTELEDWPKNTSVVTQTAENTQQPISHEKQLEAIDKSLDSVNEFITSNKKATPIKVNVSALRLPTTGNEDPEKNLSHLAREVLKRIETVLQDHSKNEQPFTKETFKEFINERLLFNHDDLSNKEKLTVQTAWNHITNYTPGQDEVITIAQNYLPNIRSSIKALKDGKLIISGDTITTINPIYKGDDAKNKYPKERENDIPKEERIQIIELTPRKLSSDITHRTEADPEIEPLENRLAELLKTIQERGPHILDGAPAEKTQEMKEAIDFFSRLADKNKNLRPDSQKSNNTSGKTKPIPKDNQKASPTTDADTSAKKEGQQHENLENAIKKSTPKTGQNAILKDAVQPSISVQDIQKTPYAVLNEENTTPKETQTQVKKPTSIPSHSAQTPPEIKPLENRLAELLETIQERGPHILDGAPAEQIQAMKEVIDFFSRLANKNLRPDSQKSNNTSGKTTPIPKDTQKKATDKTAKEKQQPKGFEGTLESTIKKNVSPTGPKAELLNSIEKSDTHDIPPGAQYLKDQHPDTASPDPSDKTQKNTSTGTEKQTAEHPTPSTVAQTKAEDEPAKKENQQQKIEKDLIDAIQKEKPLFNPDGTPISEVSRLIDFFNNLNPQETPANRTNTKDAAKKKGDTDQPLKASIEKLLKSLKENAPTSKKIESVKHFIASSTGEQKKEREQQPKGFEGTFENAIKKRAPSTNQDGTSREPLQDGTSREPLQEGTAFFDNSGAQYLKAQYPDATPSDKAPEDTSKGIEAQTVEHPTSPSTAAQTKAEDEPAKKENQQQKIEKDLIDAIQKEKPLFNPDGTPISEVSRLIDFFNNLALQEALKTPAHRTNTKDPAQKKGDTDQPLKVSIEELLKSLKENAPTSKKIESVKHFIASSPGERKKEREQQPKGFEGTFPIQPGTATDHAAAQPLHPPYPQKHIAKHGDKPLSSKFTKGKKSDIEENEGKGTPEEISFHPHGEGLQSPETLKDTENKAQQAERLSKETQSNGAKNAQNIGSATPDRLKAHTAVGSTAQGLNKVQPTKTTENTEGKQEGQATAPVHKGTIPQATENAKDLTQPEEQAVPAEQPPTLEPILIGTRHTPKPSPPPSHSTSPSAEQDVWVRIKNQCEILIKKPDVKVKIELHPKSTKSASSHTRRNSVVLEGNDNGAVFAQRSNQPPPTSTSAYEGLTLTSTHNNVTRSYIMKEHPSFGNVSITPHAKNPIGNEQELYDEAKTIVLQFIAQSVETDNYHMSINLVNPKLAAYVEAISNAISNQELLSEKGEPLIASVTMGNKTVSTAQQDTAANFMKGERANVLLNEIVGKYPQRSQQAAAAPSEDQQSSYNGPPRRPSN